jgi:undecaprenyl-diphosphatase
MDTNFANIDFYLFQKINQFAGKFVCLDSAAIFFAKYFEYFLIFFLFLFLVKNFRRYWPMVVQAFLAAIFSRFIITNIIRWLWPRPRPFVENYINLLFNYNPAEPAFPSGHAAFYFAIATVVFLYINPHTKFGVGVGLLFFIASFLISIARVFSGIHWPSDILVGALVGIFSGWLIIFLSRKFFPDDGKQTLQSK